MAETPLYAHSLPGAAKSQWQPLRQHLEAVAGLARRNASAFEAGDWGRLAGLWHDLGKLHPAFQRRISEPNCTEKVEHSLAGALLAHELQGPGLALAFCIAGHHAGLADLHGGDQPGGPTPLVARLRRGDREELRSLLAESPLSSLAAEVAPEPPEWFADVDPSRKAESMRRFELWTRFLFSSLVDADYTDTENFYTPGRRRGEMAGFADIGVLRRRLDRHVDELVASLDPVARESTVNHARSGILAACRRAAESAPGFFSLTVPTGGGKTLSGMAFALAHAERHGLRRIIVAIPYTSILEQNAEQYKKALGDDQVIEHHSNLDPERESARNKLASENWDAPVVVTTNVQLFESLLANRPGRCRKVHNVARSVLLLDEVQTLPPDLLTTVLDLLRELVSTFGCTVVFSTATQPAFERREDFPEGIENVREIAPEPRHLARRLRRFVVEWPLPDAGPIEWPQLAARVADHDRVLTIVHLRKDARELASLLPEAGRFHLSALMCAAHRSEVLAEIRARLRREDGPIRLVSTQLIEAGVDVDFPLVFRALGGLDSIVQAGGRCNREGRSPPETSKLVVFRAPTSPPAGILRQGLEAMQVLLNSRGTEIDILDPEVIAQYFRLLYAKIDRDRRRVQEARQRLAFHDVATLFRMIDDAWSLPLVVPWGDAPRRLEQLREKGPSRERLRALQPFTVNVAKRDMEELRQAGAVEMPHGIVETLAPPFHHLYTEWGLFIPETGPSPDPEAYVV